MADPKYANLYGIAHDQPDVYETNDLPEADQANDIFEEKSESIEHFHIPATEAFLKFQGKELDAVSVDFSENIGKQRTDGYRVRSGNENRSDYDVEENILQKYDRLKRETECLIEDLAASERNRVENSAKLSNTIDVSVEAASEMLSRIKEIKVQDKIGFDFTGDVSQPGRLDFERLLNHLNHLSKASPGTSGSNPNTKIIPNADNSVHYLFSVKPNKQSQITSHITDLEQRVSKLETLVGSNAGHVLRLCNTNTDNGLVNCCQWMIGKLSLLDSTQLDAIETKISNVNSRTEQFLGTYYSFMQDSDKEKKIDELYELCNKMLEISDSIPSILERLTALESMHRQGKQIVQAIGHLENLQSELSAGLADGKDAFREIKETLKLQLTVIQENVNSLKSRVDVLIQTKK